MSAAVAGVRQAADALVGAFGRGDLEAYFACFHEDATFLFHTTDRLLRSTEEYRREWVIWVREDEFRVLGCESFDQHVQEYDGVAVFTHDVRTTVSTRSGQAVLRERETIVFHREDGGRWLAVHEHLSPAPGADSG